MQPSSLKPKNFTISKLEPCLNSISLNEEMGKTRFLHISRGEAILNTTQKGKGPIPQTLVSEPAWWLYPLQKKIGSFIIYSKAPWIYFNPLLAKGSITQGNKDSTQEIIIRLTNVFQQTSNKLTWLTIITSWWSCRVPMQAHYNITLGAKKESRIDSQWILSSNHQSL